MPDPAPCYLVRFGPRRFMPCATLAEALTVKARLGGTVYEPLGMAAAERACAADRLASRAYDAAFARD